jgi:plasmid stability protein
MSTARRAEGIKSSVSLACGAVKPFARREASGRLAWERSERYHDIKGASMAQLVVRNLDDEVKAKLRRRAVTHGRSMEEEVRAILRDAVKEEARPKAGLGTRIAARFAGIGLRKGEEIPELRGYRIKPVDFD